MDASSLIDLIAMDSACARRPGSSTTGTALYAKGGPMADFLSGTNEARYTLANTGCPNPREKADGCPLVSAASDGHVSLEVTGMAIDSSVISPTVTLVVADLDPGYTRPACRSRNRCAYVTSW